MKRVFTLGIVTQDGLPLSVMFVASKDKKYNRPCDIDFTSICDSLSAFGVFKNGGDIRSANVYSFYDPVKVCFRSCKLDVTAPLASAYDEFLRRLPSNG